MYLRSPLLAATARKHGRGNARQLPCTAVALDHGDGGVLFGQGPHNHFFRKLQGCNMTDMMKDKVVAVTGSGGGDVFAESLRYIAAESRILPIGFAGGTVPQIPANTLIN
jgi:NADPH2:quinone reductase